MADLVTTRRSLHAVAELLIAGPQHEEHNTVRLKVCAGGFAASVGRDVRVQGAQLAVEGATYSLAGRTIAEVAAETGITAQTLKHVYHDGIDADHETLLAIDASAATEIADALWRGHEALVPMGAPVLWPEHFDVGISLDEVNYGVSPGDSFLEVPYAYVGPWRPAEFTGAFWNAPFGSARPVSELDDLAAYFAEGRVLAASPT